MAAKVLDLTPRLVRWENVPAKCGVCGGEWDERRKVGEPPRALFCPWCKIYVENVMDEPERWPE